MNTSASQSDRGAAGLSPGLSADQLRDLALQAGADDVGIVGLEDVPSEADHAQRALKGAKSLVGFVVRMNRANIQSPERATANVDFHQTGHEVDAIGRKLVKALERMGIRAVNPAMGFPMEMDRFPDRPWTIAHKVVAEACGLGRMGIHRNVIHPKFGNFILLGTVITDLPIQRQEASERLDTNPCLNCKLCVAACPVGAVKKDGAFDFQACYDHNYQEFMGGFTNWVGDVVESKDRHDYEKRRRETETISMWQSLSFGANYKAAYCLSVCPAGEDVLTDWIGNRSEHRAQVLDPLVQREEPVYVVPGSDAERHVQRRFPHKETRPIRTGLRARTIPGLLMEMSLTFQRDFARLEGIDLRGHFRFTGHEEVEITVTIRGAELVVEHGLQGSADFRVRADSETWLAMLRGARSKARAILTGKLFVTGSLRKLGQFERCFIT